MSEKQNEKISTGHLVEKLRLMGHIGGILTGDRIRTILLSADRLEKLDERVAIMMETSDQQNIIYPITVPEVRGNES